MEAINKKQIELEKTLLDLARKIEKEFPCISVTFIENCPDCFGETVNSYSLLGDEFFLRTALTNFDEMKEMIMIYIKGISENS